MVLVLYIYTYVRCGAKKIKKEKSPACLVKVSAYVKDFLFCFFSPFFFFLYVGNYDGVGCGAGGLWCTKRTRSYLVCVYT
jgi:hypothetical protein